MPPRMVEDITQFVRDSGLTGKAFMRLNEDDLEEMGVNVRWRPMLLDAREQLRKESLAGRIMWSFAGGAVDGSPRTNMIDSPERLSRLVSGNDDKRAVDAIDEQGEPSSVLARDEGQEESWKRQRTSLANRAAGQQIEQPYTVDTSRQPSDPSTPRPVKKTSSSIEVQRSDVSSKDVTIRLRAPSRSVASVTSSAGADDTQDLRSLLSPLSDQQALSSPSMLEAHTLIKTSELEAMKSQIKQLKARLDAVESPAPEKQKKAIHTWSSLGSWTILATVAIGVVLAETLIGKTIRLLLRPQAP